MLILTLRTDNPKAEAGLYRDGQRVAYKKWQAHRALAETLHQTIKSLLDDAKIDWANIEGVVIYGGPGSFTGLRIGMAVANSLADGLNIPVVASGGEQWLEAGLDEIAKGTNHYPALPEYGQLPNITAPKK